MINVEAVNAATQQCVEQGIRVLNSFLLAETEEGHVAELLKFLQPAEGAVILDAGCGIGEIARLMQAQRPDLSFKLLNLSAEQLAMCPPGMEQIRAEFAATGLPDASVDVVMFAFSLCHSDDWIGALREAHRVLKDGGTLFLYDMARTAGENALMYKLVQARAFTLEQLGDVARRAGFAFLEGAAPTPAVYRLREVFENKALYDAAFADVVPALLRWEKVSVSDPVEWAFERHRRIAFQFSGGRDSTAALYLLRPFWNRMEVYHLNTGDQFPETEAVFNCVAADFYEATGRTIHQIMGYVHDVRREHGLPTDLLPVDNTEVGRMVSGRQVKLQSRYDCCWRALMQPMHKRMIADGITLIIRGQRDDEYAAAPKRSGETGDGFEVLYPIQDWTAERVMAYLKDNDLPLAAFYDRGVRRAPECVGCTAWWDEGRAAYMREYHPVAFDNYRGRMVTIRAEIDHQLASLDEPQPAKE